MKAPIIARSARGSLIHFIKGRLLDSAFDKTYEHYFGIDSSLKTGDFALWENSPLSYLSERDKILLLNHKGKSATKSLEKDSITIQLSFLQWCNDLEASTHNEYIIQLISIWKAHTLLLVALNAPLKNQRKLLKIANAELKTIHNKEIQTHPYLFYLRGLLFVAQGKWEEATSEFHQATQFTHNPQLYKLLVNLYLYIEMPSVSLFFTKKLNDTSKIDKELWAG